MARDINELIMIYDAPSGKLAAVSDSLKKIFGRGCSLCAMTHGLVSKRKEWQEFEEGVGVPISYLHDDEIDELKQRLGKTNLQLPAVLAELVDGEVVTLLEPDVIARSTGTPADLRERIYFYAKLYNFNLAFRASSGEEH